MHVFTSFVLFEGEKFHGGGRLWYFNVIWLKSIHTFTFIVTVFTASASIRVSARNASLYIAVMIFCAQPYLKPCFMCPFYILSTCPSKGLCTALDSSSTELYWVTGVLKSSSLVVLMSQSSPSSGSHASSRLGCSWRLWCLSRLSRSWECRDVCLWCLRFLRQLRGTGTPM